MARVHAKDTKPELLVRSVLHQEGYRFRLHARELPGIPDILLPKYKTAVFIHGCFWHAHVNCRDSGIPMTRTTFWRNKISENQERDRKNISIVGQMGWRVAIIWECALKNAKATAKTVNALDIWIKSGMNYLEIPDKSGEVN